MLALHSTIAMRLIKTGRTCEQDQIVWPCAYFRGEFFLHGSVAAGRFRVVVAER